MIETSLNTTIRNALDAINVISVLVTVLFVIYYPEMQKLLDQSLNKGKKDKLNEQKGTIQKALVFRWLPIVLFMFFSTYLITPTAITTLKSSNISVIDFDLVRTAFIFLWIIIITFFLLSLVILIQLICKIIKCYKELNKITE